MRKGKKVWKVVWIEYYLGRKILVSRLPQNTSNGNIECAGKSKKFILSDDNPFGVFMMFLFHCSDINFCLQFIILGGNYAMHDYSLMRLIQGERWRNSIVASISSDRMINDNLKSQIKNRTCTLSPLIPTHFFQCK